MIYLIDGGDFVKRLLLLLITAVVIIFGILCVSADASPYGDMNLNGRVDSDDAIYLLRYTLDKESYPVQYDGDVDGDGDVDSNDAIYLLRHTLSPDSYPLQNEPITYLKIDVKEDAYVLNRSASADQSTVNFGGESEIHVKSAGDSLTRYGLVKFDISALKGRDDFTCIELDLMLTSRQTESVAPLAAAEVYSASTDWDEYGITFAKMPATYSLVCSKNDISAHKEINSFAVTDYVRKALAAGKTEIAFCIKEITRETPLHLHFASKESGENIPALSVYFGTKEDKTEYNGFVGDLKPGEVIGLDKILGEKKYEKTSITVKEDAYVEAGSSASTNFGSSKTLDFKATKATPDNFYRRIFLKFDISNIDASFFSANLLLNCISAEAPGEAVNVKIYECDPNSWSENSITYNTMPSVSEANYITTAIMAGSGQFSADLHSYILKCLEQGKTSISICLVGDNSKTPRRLTFDSREGETAPAICFSYGDSAFTTDIAYTGENPWNVAMTAVTAWLDRWEDIKKGGDPDTERVIKNSAEYALTVDACRAADTDGYNTRYKQYPTRNISTLKGYVANTSEVKKYDVYGGLMDESMRQTETGFFYTKKIGDRWWTIDPLGYPFYRTAVVTVSMGNASFRNKFLSKYGSTSKWAQAVTDRLFELGFNSVGGWSSIDTLIGAEAPLSQTAIIGLVGSYASSKGLNISQSGSTDLVGNVLPVFDPEFSAYTDNKVKTTVSKYANSPNVYGWMSDNELPDRKNMLDNALTFDTQDKRFAYSYATAWTFMYMKIGKSTVSLSDVTDELRREYRAMVYDKLFYETCTALDKYDPNHQFMGCRFLTNCYKDEYVLRVAGYWCDVITFNYYGVWEPEADVMANIQKWAGKPFVITEWYAKGMDVWEQDNRMTNKSGAGWTVRTQNDRGRFYHNYALQLLECKGCVGFDWFKFLDNDPDDLSTDLSNRNANKGIIANDLSEYTDLTRYMKELNTQKYNLIKFFDNR